MMDRNDMDVYAAEYVLGTLDKDERTEIIAWRATDMAMDTAIAGWEKKFAPLNDMTPEATPSADVFAKIEQRILALSLGHPHSVRPPSKKKFALWHSLALAACLVILLVSGGLQRFYSVQGFPQFVAVLQKDTASPEFVISLNEKTATLAIRSISAQPPPDKSYELWFIPEGEKTPHSLGITSSTDIKSVALKGISPAVIRDATLAISLEPLGGSPTGAPTGPVIVTGKFVPTKT